MANAIKTISVQRGYDVTEYVLNSFGGAGGQHACLVADALGIKSVLHPSAVGRAVGVRHGARLAQRAPARAPCSSGSTTTGWPSSPRSARRWKTDVRQELERQGVDGGEIAVSAQAHLRYAGTDSALPIPLASLRGMRALFEIAHQQRFGFISPEKDIEIEAIEVEAKGGGEPIAEPDLAEQTTRACVARTRTTEIFTQRQLARGADLPARRACAGPHRSQDRR